MLMIMIHDNIPHGVVRQIFFKNSIPKKQLVKSNGKFSFTIFFLKVVFSILSENGKFREIKNRFSNFLAHCDMPSHAFLLPKKVYIFYRDFD